MDSRSYSISSEITKPPSVEATREEPFLLDQDSLTKQAEDAALDILANAEQRAAEIISKAQEQAKRIGEDAAAKSEQVYEDVRAKAQDEGYAQGFDVGQSEAQVLLDEALMIKEEWVLNRKEFISKVENDLIELCLSSVKNIINREIEDESYILDIIKKGIDNLTYTVNLTVRVSDFDYDYVVANKSKVLAMIEGVEDIEIKKDLSLEHTDCVIDSDTGSIDVGVESQFEQLKRIMNALLAGEAYD